MITIDDLVHLPKLGFDETRKVGKPVEMGLIAPVRRDESLVQFEAETIVLGTYRDTTGGKEYLIHTPSLRPFGGFPEATPLDQIHEYRRVRDY